MLSYKNNEVQHMNNLLLAAIAKTGEMFGTDCEGIDLSKDVFSDPFAHLDAKKAQLEDIQMDESASPRGFLPTQPIALEAPKPVETNERYCLFKTRKGGFKKYSIAIEGDMLVFSRPQSSKQQLMQYEIQKFQCLAQAGLEADLHRLKLVTSADQSRSVYFRSEEELAFWHCEILSKQGFA
jgi:hypothetical protein